MVPDEKEMVVPEVSKKKINSMGMKLLDTHDNTALPTWIDYNATVKHIYTLGPGTQTLILTFRVMKPKKLPP